MSTDRLTGAWCAALKASLAGPTRSQSSGASTQGALALSGSVESSVFGVAERVDLAWPPSPLAAAENLLIEAPEALGAASVRVTVDGDRVVRVVNLELSAGGRSGELRGFAMHLAEKSDGAPRLLTLEAYPERDAVGAPMARRTLRIEGLGRRPEGRGPLLSPKLEPTGPKVAAEAGPAPRKEVVRSARAVTALGQAIAAARGVAQLAENRPARGAVAAAVAQSSAVVAPIAPRPRTLAAQTAVDPTATAGELVSAAPEAALEALIRMVDPRTDFALGVLAADAPLLKQTGDKPVHLQVEVTGDAALRATRMRLTVLDGRGATIRTEDALTTPIEGMAVAQSYAWSFVEANSSLKVDALDEDGRVLTSWRYPETQAERGAARARKRGFVGAGLSRRAAEAVGLVAAGAGDGPSEG